MTWTAQAGSSAVAAAASGDIKYAHDNRVAGLACRHTEVLSQRVTVKVDTEGAPESYKAGGAFARDGALGAGDHF